MTTYDIPVLWSVGFKAGPLAASWFGKDRNGFEWQAYVGDVNNLLMFRTQHGNVFGPEGPLYAADFDKLFTGES